jgi:hypothetical protein
LNEGAGQGADVLCQEQMTNGDGRNLKMGFEDWDFIGQGTASLTTIAAVVTEQAEGHKYVTSSLVPPFTNVVWPCKRAE